MRIEDVLDAAPLFDEPEQPLGTKDEMARWLVWQRFRHGGQASPVRFYNALMRESKESLLQRCQRWPHFYHAANE